ncbi:hypothetical protein GB928_027700 [Shinella curvata]|uniref:TnsA endonuclease-like protein n=1 Tax=Shinella curvata TaxID=1817964 RepID=A0ABT8XMK1_9HYPH|nr:hypothetical protein [Shinella curvata]MCJ8057180.1 hypothetical protein [Shinella curvata]MDO6124973.1 hypothetical protein [Shinella curvata]
MTVITNEHIEFALGRKGAKKAKKRRTGGDANDSGHEFEKAFTLSSILVEINRELTGPTRSQVVRFQSQPLGFVDDLVIYRGATYCDYYELKSGTTQRCTTALKYNIARQQKVLCENRIRGRINIVLRKHLVHAGVAVKRRTGAPISIVGFEEDVRRDLKAILGAVPDLADSYKLITLRILLDGAWHSLGRSADVAKIIAEWRFLANYAVFSSSPTGVSRALTDFFTDVGLELKDERDVVRFKLNGIGGLFLFPVGSPRWKAFERHLLDAKPSDPMVLYEIIERFNHA